MKEIIKIKINVNKLKKILKYYGEETQALKAIEELAELQRAIARQDLENMEEELADVLIMSIQLLYFTGIRKEEVLKKFNYKLDRQLKRINAVG